MTPCLLLLLVTVILAQYPTAPRYGVSNYYGYGNNYYQQPAGYNMNQMNSRQYYQNQYASQNYYNDYNRYYNDYYR